MEIGLRTIKKRINFVYTKIPKKWLIEEDLKKIELLFVLS